MPKNVASLCTLCQRYFWREKLKPIEIDDSPLNIDGEKYKKYIESGWICELCKKHLDGNRGAVLQVSNEEFQAKYYQE